MRHAKNIIKSLRRADKPKYQYAYFKGFGLVEYTYDRYIYDIRKNAQNPYFTMINN